MNTANKILGFNQHFICLGNLRCQVNSCGSLYEWSGVTHTGFRMSGSGSTIAECEQEALGYMARMIFRGEGGR